MTKLIAKWVLKYYVRLWSEFSENAFTREEGGSVIGKDSLTGVVLSELRKAKWLSETLDEKDARKRIYHLLNPTKIIESIENV